MRGFQAPPRSTVAPAAFTARAASRICSRDSTEHGPAITTMRGPPSTTPSPRSMRVSSPLTSRETSFHGCETRMVSATPGKPSKRTGSSGPLLPVMPMATRSAPGMGCGVRPRERIRSATRSTSTSVALGFITMSMARESTARRGRRHVPARRSRPEPRDSLPESSRARGSSSSRAGPSPAGCSLGNGSAAPRCCQLGVTGDPHQEGTATLAFQAVERSDPGCGGCNEAAVWRRPFELSRRESLT